MLQQQIEIDATPDAVWAALGDVRNLARWSPQVLSTRLSDGAEACALGTRFTNKNQAGELVWVTHAEITAYEERVGLSFRVEENYAVWSFALQPCPGGTTVIQRRETPDGISELSRELTDGFMGGQDAFTETMRAGMRATLAALKAEVETAEGLRP